PQAAHTDAATNALLTPALDVPTTPTGVHPAARLPERQAPGHHVTAPAPLPTAPSHRHDHHRRPRSRTCLAHRSRRSPPSPAPPGAAAAAHRSSAPPRAHSAHHHAAPHRCPAAPHTAAQTPQVHFAVAPYPAHLLSTHSNTRPHTPGVRRLAS